MFKWLKKKKPAKRELEVVTKYGKMPRLESCVIEEKLDGSNFCWTKINGELRFYSRKNEIALGVGDKFFQKFIIMLLEIEKEKPFPEGVEFYAEALSMAQIKYFQGSNVPTSDKLYIFDIKYPSGFVKRSKMEEMAAEHGLNCVPLTTFDNKYSVLNPEVLREGIILRYDFFGKIKQVENKMHSGKSIPASSVNIVYITKD